MRVALEVWSSDVAEVEATCLRAEALGLDAFYYGESPHDLNLDCWTTLAGLARTTRRIRLGPVITNVLPTYRSTALLAKQATTVAALADGRLDFRTGVGASAEFGRQWWEPFGVDYPDYGQRLDDLEQALKALPHLWQNASTTPPITIAATGGRAMTLTASYADVWETSFCTPAEFATRNATFAGLLEPERPVVRSLEIDGFVSCTAAGFQRLLDRVRAERGEAEDLDAIFERALVGVPSKAAIRLRELAAVGVDQVVVALHDPHDADALDAIAETVSLLS